VYDVLLNTCILQRWELAWQEEERGKVKIKAKKEMACRKEEGGDLELHTT